MRSETYWAEIFIAGSCHVIDSVCREFTDRVGLCVTVTPTTFIYTGGAESGAIVGLINYPRFPATPENIDSKAKALGKILAAACFQKSFSVMTPETTYFYASPDKEKS